MASRGAPARCSSGPSRFWTRALGESHPNRGTALLNIANLQLAAGEVEQARATAEEALELLAEAHGEDHRQVAAAVQTLADIAWAAGDADEAGRLYRRARAILEAIGFADDADLVRDNWAGLGRVRLHEGDVDAAAEAFERGLAGAAEDGAPSMTRADLELGLAEVRWAQGQTRAAVELARSARDGYAALGPRAEGSLARAEQWLRAHRTPG